MNRFGIFRGLGLPLRMDTQSLVATGRSFVEVYNYSQTMEEMHCEVQGGTIRNLITKVVFVGAGVAHSSGAKVLKVDTSCVCVINIRVNLVGLFMSHFRLPIVISLVTVIILARVVVSL